MGLDEGIVEAMGAFPNERDQRRMEETVLSSLVPDLVRAKREERRDDEPARRSRAGQWAV